MDDKTLQDNIDRRTYIVDWAANGTDPIRTTPLRLDEAKRSASALSREFGSAYVIRQIDGNDDAQIAFYDGTADGDWQT